MPPSRFPGGSVPIYLVMSSLGVVYRMKIRRKAYCHDAPFLLYLETIDEEKPCSLTGHRVRGGHRRDRYILWALRGKAQDGVGSRAVDCGRRAQPGSRRLVAGGGREADAMGRRRCP